jgi:TPP-dependent pyruvate/acetoin dehydrogenase alpha subunit
MTYRIGAHSTADDESRYRDESDVAAWRERDPIERYRAYLLGSDAIDDAFVEACDEEAEAWVAGIRASVIALREPPPSELFDHAFADPPATLLPQREELLGDG